MRQFSRSRLSRFAFLASGAMLLLGSTAMAQTVQVFDDAPSIEQLRSILIPESLPGSSRSIVLQRPDAAASSTAVQRVSTQVLPAHRTQVDAAVTPTSRVTAREPSPVAETAAKATPPASDAPSAAGVVAFHVNFAFDSATLPDSAIAMIDLMAQLMKESPDVKVRIEGHTDATGSFDYNKALSERRAMAVSEYLIGHGVEPSRLLLAGKGPTEPLTQNRYDPANRRVQFVRVS